jgi:hypothetical protein
MATSLWAGCHSCDDPSSSLLTAGVRGELFAFDQPRVDPGTQLRNALLRVKVHVDESEPPFVAVEPFQVVVTRPDVISANVRAGRNRLLHGRDVAHDIAASPHIPDRSETIRTTVTLSGNPL